MKRLFTFSFSILILSLIISSLNAQVTFNHTYGQMPYNYGKRIIQASDQGYFILANENGNIANTNIHIIRTDSLGIILWEKTIGDASVYSANDFIRTSDNGFLITGLTNQHPGKAYDVLLVKTDSNANVLWEKTYGGTDWDMGNSVIETHDSAYLISGQTFSYGPGLANIYIIKTNFSGDTLWTKVFGGDSTDYAMSADVLFDSTYLIGATTNSFGHGNFDGYVLNLNKNGNTIWTQTYGEDKEDIIYSIKQTPDSGFVFVGSTMSYNAIEHDNWLMKFDKSNNLKWKMPETSDIGWADDVAYSVSIGDSGHYILSGFTNGAGNGGKDLSFLVMGENHNFIHSLTGGFAGDDIGNDAIQTRDGGYIMIGTSENFGIGISGIYVIKISNEFNFSSTTQHLSAIEEIEAKNNNSNFVIFPHISNGIFYLKLKDELNQDSFHVFVYDVMGRLINNHNSKKQSSEFLIDISDEAAGLYVITVFNNEHVLCFKVIKQ